MILRHVRFNNYLWLALLALAVWLPACSSTGGKKKDKEATTLSLFLEANPGAGDRVAAVPVLRANPVLVYIDKTPFMDGSNVQRAEVVEVVGGFAIKLQFDRQGALLLGNITGANPGRCIAIYSRFTEGRWLGAPRVTRPITDGALVFTPDATREEADRIVRGLNNLAEELRKRNGP